MGGLSYSKAGVDTGLAARETSALARVLAQTAAFRTDVGRSVLPNGYYASALRLTDELALGLCTDGVGSKLLVAEQVGRYDTVGIDCIAMNVNDLVCIGAEPIALVDYIGIETLQPGVMEEVAKGLLEGARQSNISIPGGETAQLPDIIRGAKPGHGIDLVGTAVGVVPMERLNDGSRCAPGDVVIGLASSGVHSNGLTLARKALFDKGGLSPDSHVDELGQTAGEALLTPTRIYVKEALALLDSELDIKALCHITGDGLLNLNRVAAPVSFLLDTLPEPPAIFGVIQKLGGVDTAEMYTVFNMGIGMCVVAGAGDADSVCEIARAHGSEPTVIGSVVEGAEKRVELSALNLSGTESRFA
ncbi:MAG: phosphoribosylformylglycinamidine cyclo-ligase [Planctomycetota bacterium]|jgi:phosphoribosylformylglycinamidine cyclo-ligase